MMEERIGNTLGEFIDACRFSDGMTKVLDKVILDSFDEHVNLGKEKK